MSQLIKKIRTDQGDLQIDYDALANLPTISNPNLLINSDFRNPINQRNQTIYYGMATKGYTIDRWCMGNNDFERTVEVVSGGITITNPNTEYPGTFQQIFVNTLPQGDYTLSVKVSSKSGSATMSCGGSHGETRKDLNVGINTFTITSATVSSFVILVASRSSVTLEWAKLEAGTTATPFVPRIYIEEVVLCKGFYQVITLYNSDIVCCLHQRDANRYCGVMHFDAMHTVPTVTRLGDFYIEQYNVNGVFAMMEDQITSIEMTPQWEAIRFDIELTTPDPVNYLSVASESLVFRFDAEIY